MNKYKIYLVIKTRDDIKNQINNECKEIYQKKLNVKNEILKRTKSIDSKFILIDNEDEISREFKSTWTYISTLLDNLWDEPYIIYQILSNAHIKDIKNNLASFFANNFYENILSSNYIEDNLMYIISLLLKQEIDKLNDVNEPEIFLENTACGYLLEQLCEKKDIKSFCKLNILNIVKNLEWTFSSKRICFDIDSINEYCLKIEEEKKNSKKKINENNRKTLKKSKTTIFYEDNHNMRANSTLSLSSISNFQIDNEEAKKEEEILIFNTKYMCDITFEVLDKKLSNFIKDKNDKMEEYIKYQIKNRNNDNNIEENIEEIYSYDSFISNLYNKEKPGEILSVYISSFFKTIESIDMLFNNLITNSHLFPYSLKCICKIILYLIKKKFPKINITQQNAFISRFFFNKILLPIFENPAYCGFINEYMISGQTIINLKAISNIISQLCSGKFYLKDKKGNYILFNNYFIEAMPNVFKFFGDITKDISELKLPTFLEFLIKDNLPKFFKPNYFRENPEEILYHRSILLNFDDIYTLINNMNECKDKIFVREETKLLETIFNKVNKSNNMKILEELKNKITYAINQDNNIKNKAKNKEEKIIIKKYFLTSKILINEKNSYIFDMNQEKKYFNINELEDTEIKENINKNNIIKVKNLISSILYNYRVLKEVDFKKDKIIDTINIFKELNNYIISSGFFIDETVPTDWYINTLLDYINKIPEEYSENDYQLLYKELEEEINNSMKKLNFDIFYTFIDKLQFAKMNKIYYQKAKKSLEDIYLNEKVQLIVEYTKIPCELYFCFNEKEKKLNIKELKAEDMSLNFLDNLIFKEPKKGATICTTIRSFTKHFPNIAESRLFCKENSKIFELLKQLQIPKSIQNYLKIIKKHLYKLKIWSTEEEFNYINNKIYDFVTEKIYDKIYPKISCELDMIIHENCLKLSWTEPKHYIKDNNNYIYENVLPDILYDFKEINIQKSPRLKIFFMKDIFKCIDNLGKISGENSNEFGIDNQVSILTYAFIKAKPNNIETNCNYLELFIEKDTEEDNLLTQLRLICKYVHEIDKINLNGVSKEEFNYNINTNIKG